MSSTPQTLSTRLDLPSKRQHLNIGLTNNFEAAAFTEHEKLLWITHERVNKFLKDDEWASVNLSKGRLYFESVNPKTVEVYSPTFPQRPLFADVMKVAKWKPAKVGDKFGPSWSTHWFKLECVIPDHWKNKEVHLRWNSSSEATLWTEHGECLQGFAGGTDQLRTQHVFRANTHWPITLFVEMACNHPFGCGDVLAGISDRTCTFELTECCLGLFNREAWDLIWDMRILFDMEQELPRKSLKSLRALRTVNEIVNVVDPLNTSTYSKGREIAKEFFDHRNSESQFEVFAVGHCHIDTAWLWPYAETRRKVIRSWASQIKLIEMYPKYHFVASQAQQYEWLQQDCPELFERLQVAVNRGKGNFHVIGGTWVEMDGNIPSGESFVRQFLYGQRYFEKHFGVRCEIFWLPDTFGYSAQLPQIIRLSGIKYFFTQKLSWNLINVFPHNSFVWEGIDGSGVLVHFAPSDTYVSQGTVKDVLASRDAYKNKASNNESLLVFGWGDGGGGPTWEHLERLQRMEDTEGIPKVEMSSPVAFYEKLEKSVDKLPRWVGELYFEMHRGTYTTHGAIKKGNRRGECLLQQCEFIHSVLGFLTPKQHEYPKKVLDQAWRDLLLNQFHDVLPGSSIELANIDARELYKQIDTNISKLIEDGKDQLWKYSTHLAKTVTGVQTIEADALVINTTGFERHEMITLSPESVPNVSKSKFVQKTFDQNLLVCVECPPYGISPLIPHEVTTQATITEHKTDETVKMENSQLQVTLDKNGCITSLLHKPTKRETIDEGCVGNEFLLFDDMPLFWDAWDVELYHLQKFKTVSDQAKDLKIIERGPLRVGVEFSVQISKDSNLVQRVFLSADSPFLLFETWVDWKEKHKMLKVQFPLNVRNEAATYEIQFGHLQRTTTLNTTVDIAKFEVVGHKWADLSEYGFGVSLLNDCKYGYSCHTNVLRLSLLRAPKRPDDKADMHQHFFRYALLPHSGSFQNANVIGHAYALNSPILTTPNKGEFPRKSIGIFKTSTPQVVLETVKKAEDDNSLILRFYEAFGGRCQCDVWINGLMTVKDAFYCNLLEEVTKNDKGQSQIDLEKSEGGTVFSMYLEPFEVKSVKVCW